MARGNLAHPVQSIALQYTLFVSSPSCPPLQIDGTAFGFWIASTLMSGAGTLYYMYHSQEKEE